MVTSICLIDKKRLLVRGRVTLLLVLIILSLATGCHSANTQNDKKVFAFNTPSGFVLSDICDKECSIINSEGAVVGGFVITDLKPKDIKKVDGIALPQYLNKMHEGCEYLSWSGDDTKHPTKHVSQYIPSSGSEEIKELYHVFFEKDGAIYDVWFDTDMIDKDEISVFVSCVVEH